MLPAQAAAALEEFLAERGPALRRLREALTAGHLDPEQLLDRSPASVGPLWEWITDRVAEFGLDPRSLVEDPTRDTWPSWARHATLVDPHPTAQTLTLVDGYVSYLAAVITTAVPQARWRVGEHRISTYPLLNYPVLAADSHQVFLPALPLFSAYHTAYGRDPMDGPEMLAHVHRTIAALRGQGPPADQSEEPVVNVVAEVDCFDVGLRPDLTAAHPELVARLAAELTGRDGVTSVYRYGPDALIVSAPDWTETRLKMWLTLWLQRHLYTNG